MPRLRGCAGCRSATLYNREGSHLRLTRRGASCETEARLRPGGVGEFVSPPLDDPVERDLGARLRSLARLARPTAHDLRGALSSVHLHLELLSTNLTADDATGRERRERCLRVLKEECERVQRLADAFLALATLPSGAREIDLGVMVGGLVSVVAPFGSERRVRLEAGQIPLLVRRVTEPETCRQRLLDALLAAVEAAPPGSTVRIRMTADGGYAEMGIVGGAATRVPVLAAQGPGDA